MCLFLMGRHGVRQRTKFWVPGLFSCTKTPLVYTYSMNKGTKAFMGIVSAAPVLLLVVLAISVTLHWKFQVLITTTAMGINIVTGIGGLLIIIGTFLAFFSQRISRIVSRPDFKATTEGLMQGPYKYSRHPGSLSLVVMYLGFALVANSIIMIGCFIVLVLLLSFIFFPSQEKVIQGLAPEAYAEYKKRVRMWL